MRKQIIALTIFPLFLMMAHSAQAGTAGTNCGDPFTRDTSAWIELNSTTGSTSYDPTSGEARTETTQVFEGLQSGTYYTVYTVEIRSAGHSLISIVTEFDADNVYVGAIERGAEYESEDWPEISLLGGTEQIEMALLTVSSPVADLYCASGGCSAATKATEQAENMITAGGEGQEAKWCCADNKDSNGCFTSCDFGRCGLVDLLFSTNVSCGNNTETWHASDGHLEGCSAGGC